MKHQYAPSHAWNSALIAAAIVAATLSVAPAARAQTSQLTDPSQLVGPVIVTPDYPGASGDTLSSPFSLSAGGNTVSFSADNGNEFLRQDSTAPFGNLPAGTKQIETFDPGTSSVDGPLTITFTKPVASFGVFSQDFAFDTETFSFTTTTSDGVVKTYDLSPVDNTSDQGTAVFLGASYTDPLGKGNGITTVQISSVSSEALLSNDFFTGPVSFVTAAAAPEPSMTVAFGLILGMGTLRIGMLVAKQRRRRQADAA